MEKKEPKRIWNKRGTVWTFCLCLMAVLAFSGFYAVNRMERAKEEQEKLSQATESEANDLEEKLADISGLAKLPDNQEEAEGQPEISGALEGGTSVQAGQTAENAGDSQDASAAGSAADEAAVNASSVQAQADISPTVSFQEADILEWPVAGTVLMDYSMDSSIFFKTLNQYKYNPALVISSEVGNQVLAAAKGIVSDISVNEEIGTTVTLDLGNNFQLKYGQLKELAVNEGDVVEKGTLLGYVSEPTKYYCMEGSNLYFAMTKDGEPVNPVLYLE